MGKNMLVNCFANSQNNIAYHSSRGPNKNLLNFQNLKWQVQYGEQKDRNKKKERWNIIVYFIILKDVE